MDESDYDYEDVCLRQEAEIDRLTHRLFQMNKALEKERAIGYREGVMTERTRWFKGQLAMKKGNDIT